MCVGMCICVNVCARKRVCAYACVHVFVCMCVRVYNIDMGISRCRSGDISEIHNGRDHL